MAEWRHCNKGKWIGPVEALSASMSCPFCGSTTDETDIEKHWADVDGVERGEYQWPSYKRDPMPPDWKPQPHPSFRAMWEWAMAQPRCYNHIVHMRNAYKLATGILVEIEP